MHVLLQISSKVENLSGLFSAWAAGGSCFVVDSYIAYAQQTGENVRPSSVLISVESKLNF